MKPISLQFRAFGPYVNEQIVDFKELSKVGLFLICGETGSGKTVILDAMTYALYGKSSGGGRGDITTMRCQLAPNELSTEVEFVFEIHSRQYKFTRTIKYGRKNLNSTQNALVLNDDGVFEPLFENPKIRDVEDKANELLGLDYEQFRQVIILPQGQFERLLVAKSTEKEEILVSLFGADKWQKAADTINSKVNEERRRLDSQKSNIDRSLMDKGCQNFEELNTLLGLKSEELKVKNKEITDLVKLLDKAKKEYDIKNNIFEKISSLEKAKSKIELLKQQEDEISALKDKLGKATKADTVKPVFDNLEVAEKLFKERDLQVKGEEEKLTACVSDLQASKDRLDKLDALVTENDTDKIKFSKLVEMTEFYNKIDESQKALKTAEKEYNLNIKAVEKQMETVQRLSNEKLILSQSESIIYTDYTQMFSSFIGNISGTLALELKDSMPCPVCGSIEHPTPAKILDTDVTNEMLEAKKVEIEEIRECIKNMTSELEQATEGLNKQKDDLNNANINKEKVAGEYKNLLKNIDSEIKNTSELNSSISTIKKKISDFEENLKQGKENLNKIQTDYDTHKATMDLLEKELGKASKTYNVLNLSFDKKLSELSFINISAFKGSLLDENEKSELNNKIIDYKIECESVAKNISELQVELGNNKKPNIDEVKEHLKELEGNNLNLTAEIAVISQVIKELTELSASLADQIKKFEYDDVRCRENQIFARHLNGVNGVSLQRYVLGVMLTSITTEANRLLENVHNGRYKLFRTLETTGGTRKAGLELEVFDSLSGERRSVVSLSGGEKFLVALSLSIGLSAVVQAQSGGIKLDAMFIDEGFGSLDSSSIGDALMILSNIKKTNGLVGIISHVASLKENIDAKIEVVKNNNGSNLVIKT